MGLDAVYATTPLSAIELSKAFIDTDSVVDVCELFRRYFAAIACDLDERATLAHEVGMIDRVLGDAMRRLCTVLSHQRSSWPPILTNDLTQVRRVRIVNGCHSRMVTTKQRSFGCQFGSDALVIVIHQHQLCSQRFVQCMPPSDKLAASLLQALVGCASRLVLSQDLFGLLAHFT